MVKMNSTGDLDAVDENSTEYKCPNKTHTGEFDWSPRLQGFILSSFYYGYVVTQIPGGYLAERYGGKWIIGVAVLATSMLTLLTPIAARNSVVLLIVVRILEGMFQGVISPGMHAMWSLWAPKWEITRLALCSYTGVTIGTVLAMSLSGYFSSSAFLGGWPAAFYVFGILGCLWFVPWCFLTYDSPTKHPRISKEELAYIQKFKTENSKQNRRTPWLRLVTSMPVWAIVVVYVCVNWGLITMLTNLPTYLGRILHFNLTENGILSAIPYLGMFVTVNVSSVIADYVRSHGYLSTKTTHKLFVVVGLCVPAVLMVSGGYAGDNAYLSLTLVILSIMFHGVASAGYHVNHVDIAPMYAGTLMGISNSIGNVPGFVAPLVVGLLIEHNETRTQWQYVFSIAAAINVFGALFYVIFGDGEEQWWAKDTETDNRQN